MSPFNKLCIICLTAAGMISAHFAFCKETNFLKISEIAWMGTSLSSADEWIELYNAGDDPLSLEGWYLQLGESKIFLEGTILPHSFYLLERTDEDTLPEAAADQIYKGSLKNNGTKMQIFDPLSGLVEEIDCSGGWFAGNNEGKLTMERKDYSASPNIPGSWQSSRDQGGTPKDKNSKQESFLSQEEASFSENVYPEDPPPIPAIAAGTALFSCATIFLLKKEVKKEYNKTYERT